MLIKDYITGRFEGSFLDDKRHGYGKMEYLDGSLYIGNWTMDVCDGHGTFKSNDGSNYCGEWRGDKQHGRGLYVDPDGNNYEVTFVDGNISGYGSMTALNGDIYTGNWLNNDMNGFGEMKYTDGNTYSGEWLNGQPNGQGVMTFSNGAVYTGVLNKGSRQGLHGVMRYANGDVYSGEWKEDRRHGMGVMKYANGNVYCGSWHRDRRLGSGEMYWKANLSTSSVDLHSASFDESNAMDTLTRIYSGHWMDDLMHGHGVMRWCTSSDSGEFESTIQRIAAKSSAGSDSHGSADHASITSEEIPPPVRPFSFTYDDIFPSSSSSSSSFLGSCLWYEGQWECGVRAGFGVFLDAQGDVFEGFWDKNMMHGVVGTYHYKCTNNKNRKRHGDVVLDVTASKETRDIHRTLTPITYYGEWYENHYHGEGLIAYKKVSLLSDSGDNNEELEETIVEERGEWCEGKRMK